MHDYFTANALFSRKKKLTSTHKAQFSILVSTDAAWDQRSGMAGYGFIIYTNQLVFFLAGATGDLCSSLLEAELCAIPLALEHCCVNGWIPCILFTDCRCAIQLLKNFNNAVAWRLATIIKSIKNITHLWDDFSFDHIQCDLNFVADQLGRFESANPQVSLFV